MKISLLIGSFVVLICSCIFLLINLQKKDHQLTYQDKILQIVEHENKTNKADLNHEQEINLAQVIENSNNPNIKTTGTNQILSSELSNYTNKVFVILYDWSNQAEYQKAYQKLLQAKLIVPELKNNQALFASDLGKDHTSTIKALHLSSEFVQAIPFPTTDDHKILVYVTYRTKNDDIEPVTQSCVWELTFNKSINDFISIDSNTDFPKVIDAQIITNIPSKPSEAN